ncbi:MAG: hypothetical protein JOY84_12500 [Curvibacter sp.]|nr:hypothetical protein [Curvibacter sp.]
MKTTLSHLPAVTLLCLVLSGPALAHAQRPADERLLGLSETELQEALPGLQHLRRPLPGPHGLRGTWSLSGPDGAEGVLSTVFFFQQQRVFHIEQRWSGPAGHCQAGRRYGLLRQQMDSEFGIGVTAGQEGDPQRSSGWAAGSFDVRLHLNEAGGQCQVVLVHEVHQERDPSEL